jgi:hypothetical protein
MRRVIPVLGLVLLFASSAAAQKLEVFGGYVYSHEITTDSISASGNGGSADVAFFPLGHLGLVANLGGGDSSGFIHTQSGVATTYNASESNFHYLFGPRARFGINRVSIYLQLLGGGVSRSSIVDSDTADAGKPGPNGGLVIPYTFAPAATSWAVQPALGVDVGITYHWAVRIGQVGDTITGFKPISSGKSVALQFNFSYSAGVVFRL